jgi:LAO/AO transport system kinase
MFVLMQLPNAGDDLQAIKKGVMELADMVVINKADIDADAATRARAQITSALRLFSQHGRAHESARVMQLSALKNEGVDEFWQAVAAYRDSHTASGELDARRRHQSLAWMWERIEAGLKQQFHQSPQVRELLPRLKAEVEAGRIPASTAARQLLQAGQP